MSTKQLIAEQLGIKSSELSVTHGRGTARHWLHIVTPKEIDQSLQEKVEKLLVKQKIVGSYFTDYGGDMDDFAPCILWRIKRD